VAETTQQAPKEDNALRDKCGEWMGNYVIICEHEMRIVKDECNEWMEHIIHPWKPASQAK